MAKAILSAPDSVNHCYKLISKLWKFHSAYECIEAMENQNILHGGGGSDWPTTISIALNFANAVLKETVTAMMEEGLPSESDVKSLWRAYSIYECAQAKVVVELNTDFNSVSSALELLNSELNECICELADLPKPETLQ